MSKAVMFDMDDARKAKFKAASGKIVDILQAEFENPIEAYMVLKFMLASWEQVYDIKGSMVYEKDKEAHA